jgi:membrane protease YdiL (CAAX protease family)
MAEDLTELQNSEETPKPKKRSFFNRIFVGRDGIRVIWRILIFLAICVALGAIIGTVIRYFHKPSHKHSTVQTPVSMLIGEAVFAGIVAIATWLMSLIERRKFMTYNLAANDKLRRFFTGIFWGFIALSSLVGILWISGLITFSGVALHGADVFIYAGSWAAVFLAVAFFEEMFVRGYLQYTLTKGLNFWWAALLTSLFFMALHLTNTGETAIGLTSVAAVGLTFCLSIYYTGSLWWALGFHASWDWAQSYFYGTSDSGMTNAGHFLNTHPTGNPFWSGGPDGPEGSALIIPLLIWVCLCMWLWWGRKKAAVVTN